jgi:hypothetical protein
MYDRAVMGKTPVALCRGADRRISPGGIAAPIFGKSFGLATSIADETVEPLKNIERCRPQKTTNPRCQA